MAALRGAQALSLRSTISPNVVRCFAIAGEVFQSGDAVGVSPSLRTLSLILGQHVEAHFKSSVY